MKSIKTLKKQILAKIKPKEVETRIVDDTLAEINQALKINKIKAQCVVGGSFAKDTNLKNDFDVDLFVRFDYKKYLATDKKHKLSDLLEGVLIEVFPKTERVHGSRDYFHLKEQKFDFEIVPVLNIKDPKKAMNVTDMSPLHVDWVKKHKRSDEIRLSKAFCKAAKCYGAESYIKGFSGHVLDILTIYYRSFDKFIEAASNWDEEIKKKENNWKIIIDINDVYKGKALQNLNKSKTHSPLIIIDPVLPERNAAAAMSRERFDFFVEKAKLFIKKPSASFFRGKAISKSSVKSGKDKLIFLEAEAVEGKPDVVGAKLLKVFSHLKKYLRGNDFIIKDLGWEFNKEKREAAMYFVIDPKMLPETTIRTGPPVKAKKHAEEFLEKHETTFEKNGRLFAEIKRTYRAPEPLVHDLIKGDYIKERVSKIKVV